MLAIWPRGYISREKTFCPRDDNVVPQPWLYLLYLFSRLQRLLKTTTEQETTSWHAPTSELSHSHSQPQRSPASAVFSQCRTDRVTGVTLWTEVRAWIYENSRVNPLLEKKTLLRSF
ncbi:hypothetical protein PILCRDRAFT_130991 [Piloderma croceum F 1598]|uniref:Uncharacterized protein n=1 Tax=Piloderma croceum (strain F 1598) TaxID=765440 RepID=A0A0C3GIN7_PILCF|nr:hypothetical protein PILCRDRAFT_130991 [Piloderma croceum F 1598]